MKGLIGFGGQLAPVGQDAPDHAAFVGDSHAARREQEFQIRLRSAHGARETGSGAVLRTLRDIASGRSQLAKLVHLRLGRGLERNLVADGAASETPGLYFVI